MFNMTRRPKIPKPITKDRAAKSKAIGSSPIATSEAKTSKPKIYMKEAFAQVFGKMQN
jgi:hypothetical protein